MRHKRLCTKFLGPRVMLALQVWLWLLLFIFQNEFRISFAAEPGYLDFDNLPDTNFSCTGKVIGGYYADLETDCQMFHVCTIGQLEEPMDIKFLCLNGTVFDQETRVCERVDEVDCSKSEHFYSLNLELYGNTAPPIIKAESIKTADEEIDGDEDYDDVEEVYEPSTTRKPTTTSATTTTTEKSTPSTTRSYHTTPKISYYQTTLQNYNPSHDDDQGVDDDENYDMPEESESNKTTPILSKPQINVDSQVPKPLPKLVQKNPLYGTNNEHDAINPTEINDNSQIFSPQQFIYHHNNHEDRKTPAISFQQHTYSNNGQNSHVTVTTHTGRNNFNAENPSQTPRTEKGFISSTPQSVTKGYSEKTPYSYQPYNTPKRVPLIPPSSQIQPPTGHPGLSAPKHQKDTIFYNYNKPQGFKPSPSSQSFKPSATTPRISQSYQPSERHEVALDSDYEFEKLSPDFPYIHQDFSSHYHFDKRSQGANKYDVNPTDKTTESRTTSTTPYYNTWATRNNNYTKSLPRVIVTASASVSDSNGKKLNYTVGNLVHAVKPIVTTNYDDYKESDVLLDPFFLDVPKLKKDRKRRSNNSKRKKRQTVIKVFKYDKIDPVITSPLDDLLSEAKPTQADVKLKETTEESPHWVPPDYVDDNYEPIVYQETSKPNKTLPHDKINNSSMKSKPYDFTTENNIAKTTLDMAKIEETTTAFTTSKRKDVKNYKLVSVQAVNLSDKVNLQHACGSKNFYKFYSDKTDCRTFHMCIPGQGRQVLDVLFICDLGMFFDGTHCIAHIGNDCES